MASKLVAEKPGAMIAAKRSMLRYDANSDFMRGNDTLLLPSISNSEYHSGPGLSKTDLCLVGKSVNHFLYGMEFKKQTPQMLLGTMVHTMVLEPQNYYYYVSDSLKEIPDGFIPVPEELILKAALIAEKVLENPTAAGLFSARGQAETSYYARYGDIILRCRPDWYIPEDNLIVDLKTSITADPSEFGRSAYMFDYYIQHPYYCDIVAQYAGCPQSFYFVVVETSPPYNCTVMSLEEKDIQLGRKRYKEYLHRLITALDNPGAYMGYSSQIESLALPGWARRR